MKAEFILFFVLLIITIYIVSTEADKSLETIVISPNKTLFIKSTDGDDNKYLIYNFLLLENVLNNPDTNKIEISPKLDFSNSTNNTSTDKTDSSKKQEEEIVPAIVNVTNIPNNQPLISTADGTTNNLTNDSNFTQEPISSNEKLSDNENNNNLSEEVDSKSTMINLSKSITNEMENKDNDDAKKAEEKIPDSTNEASISDKKDEDSSNDTNNSNEEVDSKSTIIDSPTSVTNEIKNKDDDDAKKAEETIPDSTNDTSKSEKKDEESNNDTNNSNKEVDSNSTIIDSLKSVTNEMEKKDDDDAKKAEETIPDSTNDTSKSEKKDEESNNDTNNSNKEVDSNSTVIDSPKSVTNEIENKDNDDAKKAEETIPDSTNDTSKSEKKDEDSSSETNNSNKEEDSKSTIIDSPKSVTNEMESKDNDDAKKAEKTIPDSTNDTSKSEKTDEDSNNDTKDSNEEVDFNSATLETIITTTKDSSDLLKDVTSTNSPYASTDIMNNIFNNTLELTTTTVQSPLSDNDNRNDENKLRTIITPIELHKKISNESEVDLTELDKEIENDVLKKNLTTEEPDIPTPHPSYLCHDLIVGCEFYKVFCTDKNIGTHISNLCPYTCNKCVKPRTSVCHDTFNNCILAKHLGYCNSTLILESHRKQYCSKTCDLCD
ncbi:ShKT domain-containing protein [Strongyloides ratti]|uniref:ShKT domain-containing protein n=1 Tax=Strongyloides ratti TaxID=34506 RepID=A0A090LS59_STRRB|nr:ShKT domain-containing protein [Strongyloides ratti]CEF71047.1 ShKT domain-containing protein [Strongyloides ratti]